MKIFPENHEGIFGLIGEIVKGTPALVGQIFNSASDTITSTVAGVSGIIKDVASRATDFSLGGSAAPEISGKCGRSAQLVQEAPLGKDGVSITEIGTMAAPPCPDFASMLKGSGLGV